LALSVDALDEPTYVKLRPPENYAGLLGTLELLKGYQESGAHIFLTALVIVNHQTIDSIENRVADIAALDLFDKIKLLEMLPIGGGRSLKMHALTHKSDLERLAAIKKSYQRRGQRVGVPLWRIENKSRGCQLGKKDMVVGPHGELAGCTLLFYLNEQVGNVHRVSLAEAWQNNFSSFRQKEQRQPAAICRACPFFTADLCWGGCQARGSIFGREAEVQRSCGVRTPEDGEWLFQTYLQSLQRGAGSIFPLSAVSEPV
jgi:radical SAM protein with 4Fe4S-binding SPASM domain